MFGIVIGYFVLLWLSRQSVALVRRRSRVQIPLAAYYCVGIGTSRNLFSGSFWFRYNVFTAGKKRTAGEAILKGEGMKKI